MNNEKLKFGLIGLLIGGVLVWSLKTTNFTSPRSTMMDIQSNTVQNSQTLDAHFIEQMIPHHQDAITMAKLAEGKATHPEIKILAQNIITSQTAEIEQMKKWYLEWYGRDVPSENQGMHMGMMDNDVDIDSLKSASDFDQAFIEEMIPHHQMAVMMANMLKSGTTRSEMKQLANNIITAQTKEIDQMRQWYKQF